ncbi:hydantoinase/carbamoylase family amidase [Pelagibius sp. Alg239-R121]|uniref:hydantoinase/carbamoylase family amidase n=1 Tax=Pelagibius sp. Alg239-R121 TaxID=2993448 RepID=UPI0024A67DE9|nr:hydantoinase/carbamoylase family amidase [Pelagibius sp. Alg239-R121]
MPKINADRLLADLRHLRSIGAVDNGVVRPAFSEEDMEARRWLKAQYEAAGLEATIDGVGNVLGRSPNAGTALLIGSHSDTQPTGGWLDGALGVVYGLEVTRALREDPETRHLAVDAVSLQDEESRFFGCMGSRSLCGFFTPEMEADAQDKDGVLLSDALRDAGLRDAPRIQLDRERYLGFLEAHIEQGPHLEEDGLGIGVVTSIVGLGGLRLKFDGQQNHAGTTMMAIRKDASAALYALANAINEEFPKVAGERSVWTMGRAVIEPGAASIVPGYAELDLQYRDKSTEVLDAFEATVSRLIDEINARGGAKITSEPARVRVAPAHMDEGFRRHLAVAAQKNTGEMWTEMPSGAFHDAGVISEFMPCAMLFIPSIGGISHDFAEDSHDDDIALGCQVLADAAASILGE